MSRGFRSFRIVCAPERVSDVENWLRAEGYTFAPEPFHACCRVLTGEPRALGESQAARFGYLYIQDRSSMLPPLALAPEEGAKVLDMCAAPGSKTGFLAQLVGPAGFVLGNEPARDRLPTLRQNLRRLSLPQAATCSHPGESLPLADGSWDFIQLDPPCSGWGTEEKNPNVRAIWTPEKTGQLVRLQRELLARAARLLTPGGRVLFSTCTTNDEENEAQVLWALENLDLEAVSLAPFPGFAFETPRLGAAGVLRTDMAAGTGQGFFLALFRKRGDAGGGESQNGEPGKLPGGRLDLRRLECPMQPGLAWENLPPGEVWDFGGQAFFLPEASLDLSGALRWQGFPLGKVSGAKFSPAPTCRALLPEWTGHEGLNLDDPADLAALLSGRSIDAPSGDGLYFRGLPLGWLRRKGKRAVWSDR